MTSNNLNNLNLLTMQDPSPIPLYQSAQATFLNPQYLQKSENLRNPKPPTISRERSLPTTRNR